MPHSRNAPNPWLQVAPMLAAIDGKAGSSNPTCSLGREENNGGGNLFRRA